MKIQNRATPNPPAGRPARLQAYAALFIALLTLAASCSRGGEYIRLEGFAQGGSWQMVCRKCPGMRAGALQARADSLLRSIDNSLSGYNRGSLLSRINAGEELPLDDHFIANFELGRKIWELSEGAFDPSAAPIFDAWGFGFTKGEEPSGSDMDSLMQFTGMGHFTLEERPDGVYLVKDDPRCRLNFNAIAQGYSCDRLGALAEEYGCTDYLAEVGREIRCKGERPGGGPWVIAIESPSAETLPGENPPHGTAVADTLRLSDCGVVTSGNYRKYYEKGGRRYAHTIDPSTGRPVEHNLLSATVLAEDAATADAYATWMMVIGTERARTVAGTLGITVWLIEDSGDMIEAGKAIPR